MDLMEDIMRNLTIRRDKTFVACLAKMKVYIEDYTSSDLTINGLPCRKLGTLKNGEEQTFLIGDHEAKVFVIADKLSKNFNNDFYTIPAGTENIYLSGKNRYNPITGNPFRFDGVANEEVRKNRKKGLRIGVAILAVSAVVGLCIGFFSAFFSAPEPETFTYEDFSITLTDEFYESAYDGFTATYDSSDCAVFVIEEEFEYFEDSDVDTLEEYCQLVIDVNEYGDDTAIKTNDGLMFFEYTGTNTQVDLEFTYIAFVYEGSDAFWLVQFAIPSEYVQEMSDDVFTWAKSVEIAQ